MATQPPPPAVEPGQFVEQSSGEVLYTDPETGEMYRFSKVKKMHMYSKLRGVQLHSLGSVLVTASLDRPDLPKPRRDMPNGL